MVDLKVKKKNGSLEDYDPEKIIEACKSAGADEEVAERIAEEVSKELPKIPSSKIRRLILEKLNSISPEVGNSMKKFDISERK
jgi:transcriptional regulator NrdR family protein